MKKFLIFCLIVFFGCTVKSNAVVSASRYDKDFLIASYLFNQEDYEKAIELLEKIYSKHKDEVIIIKLANSYIGLRKPEKAREILQNAILDEKFKTNPDINFYLGKVLIDFFNDTENSKKYLETAAKNSDNEEYKEYLALYYETIKDYASAIGIYNELIKKNENPEYYYKRGTLYIKLGIIKEGVNDLLKSDELMPNLRARLMLSDIFINQKEYEKAAEYLEKAIKLNDQFPAVQLRLSEVYKKLGDTDNYLKVLEDIVDKFQGDERFYILKQIATGYFDKGNYQKARNYFTKVVDENPDDTQALFFIGVAYEAEGDLENALKFYKKTLEVRNDFVEPRMRIAYIYFLQKNYQKALESLDKVADIDRDMDFYRLKAAILEEEGRVDEAIYVIDEGLAKNPESEELLFSLAVLKEKKKDYKETIKILKRLIEINPENAVYLNFLGYLYADLNRNLDEAYKLIEKALQIDPENAAYLDSMGWVLYRLKRYAEAYEYQLKALRLSPEEKEMRDHMEAILNALNIDKSVDDVLKE